MAQREVHVQLSHQASSNLESQPQGQQQPQSYQHQQQQQQQQPADVVGPGISKILERQRREHQEEGEEEMKRRTRILYFVLGVILLCVYFTLVKRNFFQKHHIGVPSLDSSSSETEEIRGGTLRV